STVLLQVRIRMRCLHVIGVQMCVLLFFSKGGDGRRDRNVTGVQTCALPISEVDVRNVQTQKLRGADAGCIEQFQKGEISNIHARSEERRVGKHCARRWGSKQCITEKS